MQLYKIIQNSKSKDVFLSRTVLLTLLFDRQGRPIRKIQEEARKILRLNVAAANY